MTMQAFSSQDDNSLGNVFPIAKYDESFADWSNYERCPLTSSSSLLDSRVASTSKVILAIFDVTFATAVSLQYNYRLSNETYNGYK